MTWNCPDKSGGERFRLGAGLEGVSREGEGEEGLSLLRREGKEGRARGHILYKVRAVCCVDLSPERQLTHE